MNVTKNNDMRVSAAVSAVSIVVCAVAAAAMQFISGAGWVTILLSMFVPTSLFIVLGVLLARLYIRAAYLSLFATCIVFVIIIADRML